MEQLSRELLGIDPDIVCASCKRDGAYKWGACPFCGSRYPSRAPLPVSLRVAAIADTVLPRMRPEFLRADGQIESFCQVAVAYEIAEGGSR